MLLDEPLLQIRMEGIAIYENIILIATDNLQQQIFYTLTILSSIMGPEAEFTLGNWT